MADPATNSEGAEFVVAGAQYSFAPFHGFRGEYGGALQPLVSPSRPRTDDAARPLVLTSRRFAQPRLPEEIGQGCLAVAAQASWAARGRPSQVPWSSIRRWPAGSIARLRAAPVRQSTAGCSFLNRQARRDDRLPGRHDHRRRDIPGGLGSRPFDGERASRLTRRTEVIGNGVLQGFL